MVRYFTGKLELVSSILQLIVDPSFSKLNTKEKVAYYCMAQEVI